MNVESFTWASFDPTWLSNRDRFEGQRKARRLQASIVKVTRFASREPAPLARGFVSA